MNDNGIVTAHKIIYCPITDITYEGQILISNNSHTDTIDESKDSDQDGGGGGVEADSYVDASVFYTKHGKGTIHCHRTRTTLSATFYHDDIIGHALQSVFDSTGKRALAQYEGSFLTSSSSSSSSSCNNTNTNTSTTTKTLKDSSSRKEVGNYIRHGIGKYIWPETNDVYSGEFNQGSMQGYGTMIWGSTGDSYEGPWKQGKMHGEGGTKRTAATNDVFYGSFKKGFARGWGVNEFGCGDTHEGYYKKDKRQGFGIYFWRNGEMYAGKWQNSLMDGKGVRTTEPEYNEYFQEELDSDVMDMYHGSWRSGQAEDQGIKRFACNDMYYGSYCNGQRDSYGIYEWSSLGGKYEGAFQRGHISGQGVKYMPNGDIYDGEWYKDETNGYGVKVFSNGDMHIGHYDNDCREGMGSYRWINGDEYDGFWENGEHSGFGTYKWDNVNATCRGFWRRGVRHGAFFFKRRIEIDNDSTLFSEFIYFEVWRKGKMLHRERIDWQWTDLPSIEKLYNEHASTYQLHDTEADGTDDTFIKNWTSVWESLQESHCNFNNRFMNEVSDEPPAKGKGVPLKLVTGYDCDDSNCQSIPSVDKILSVENWYRLPRKRHRGNRKSSLVSSGFRHKVRMTSRRFLSFHL